MAWLFPDISETDLKILRELTTNLAFTAAIGEDYVIDSTEAPAIRQQVGMLAEVYDQETHTQSQYTLLPERFRYEPGRQGYTLLKTQKNSSDIMEE
jgi:hypothetical protein